MGPLEAFYYIGCYAKKSYSLKNQRRLPCKVISIGNITVGGTGKTPAVIAIAKEALNRGHQPAILTRGYKGKAKGPCFVSKGQGPLLSVDEAGDEPFLMAELLRDIPVIKCADRYKGGVFAINESSLHPSMFILDDGYQHWRLFRDIDILLVDSINPFGDGRLLPSGLLREPMTGIKRADIVVITRTDPERPSAGKDEGMQDLAKGIRRYNADAPIFRSWHAPRYLKTISGVQLPADAVSGKSVLGFCGIGNPESFRKTLEGLRAGIKSFVSFSDHYRYSPEDVRRLKYLAEEHCVDWIITTEKDIMKLRGFDLPGNLGSLGIEFAADKGFYEKIFRGD